MWALERFYPHSRAQFWQRRFEGVLSCDRNLGVRFEHWRPEGQAYDA